MSHTDWRAAAACRHEDPDLFFPLGTTGHAAVQAEQAKAVCRRCPVAEACLAYALAANVGEGIFGGLTDKERTALRRAARRHKRAQAVTRPTKPEPKPRPKKTMRSAWNASAHPLKNGHIVWRGAATVYADGRTHTPKQAAFILDRGRRPKGMILPTCGERECVNPAHLADEAERTRCGTRPGYQKHLREGTEPCAPCRRANTDADNRLRWTGTTKAAL
jgi:hypothetical protein